ncbi:MAG: heme lyase CcmF/NrfE family subunit [Hyphomicrobiales bacterium]
MITELGHYALVLALAISMVQMSVPLWGAYRNDAALMRVGEPSALVQFLATGIAFACLTHAFIVSDFSVRLVWAHSHSAKPMIYKIAGVWGNHEGSMLLWVLILTLFGACVAAFGSNLPQTLRARVLAVQASIGTAFLLFILITSNPFARLEPAPFEGNGLNPVLQDPALAIHPPLLYGGYVGLSVAFSFAVAALFGGKVDGAWARWVRPWTLAAWMFLTAGIAMGSWWAYYELGWGGWWFWDPVENASFMPWLVATALLHSAVVVERRGALKIWTLLLSIIAFSLSLLGTFLVRSGVLTSVHAFASDPSRGVFILLILCLFIGGALALFAWRAPALKVGGLFAPISREGALVLNNLILTVSAISVLTGTLYPLLLEALTGAKISVGPPYFNLTFGLIILPLLLLVPYGPMLSWKRADLWAASQRLMAAGALAVIVGLIAWYLKYGGPVMAGFGIAIGVWLIAGAISEIVWRSKLFNPSGLRRLAGLPRSAFGTMLAHAGLGVLVLGVVGITAWRQEIIEVMQPSDTVEIAGVQITFKGEFPKLGPNYRDVIGRFEVRTEKGDEPEILAPAKRIYFPSQQPTSEVAIRTYLSGDLYVVMGDKVGARGRTVRVYFNPLVVLIWLGSVIMFIGGGISLSDRRLRVGAPKRARARQAKAY